jgi:hypothetical protein
LHVLLLLLLLLLVAILRWRRGVGTAVRALVPRRGRHEEHGDGEGRLQHPNRLFELPKWEANDEVWTTSFWWVGVQSEIETSSRGIFSKLLI